MHIRTITLRVLRSIWLSIAGFYGGYWGGWGGYYRGGLRLWRLRISRRLRIAVVRIGGGRGFAGGGRGFAGGAALAAAAMLVDSAAEAEADAGNDIAPQYR